MIYGGSEGCGALQRTMTGCSGSHCGDLQPPVGLKRFHEAETAVVSCLLRHNTGHKTEHEGFLVSLGKLLHPSQIQPPLHSDLHISEGKDYLPLGMN